MNEVTCGLRHPKALHAGWMLEMRRGGGRRVLPELAEKKEGSVGSGRARSSRLEKGNGRESGQKQSGLSCGCLGKVLWGPFPSELEV